MPLLPLRPFVTQILVGGYTAESDGHARGIESWLVAEDDPRRLTHVEPVEVSSPSYLVGDPNHPWVFAVSETSPGRVTSFALAADEALVPLSTSTLGGDESCHLAVTGDGRHLVIAHYGSGSLSSVGIGPDGSLTQELDLLQLTGSGPDPERQQGPHAHQVVVLGDELLVCDLGTDRIHRLTLDDRGRFSTAAPPLELPPGSGPRNLVVVGDHLVVACELSAEVWVGRRSGDGWVQVARVPSSTAPAGAVVFPSAIVADGSRVFVANRGVGSVAVFDLDAATDTLTGVAELSCGGSWPRDLVLSEGRLWVANQTDDVVTVLATASLPAAETDFAFPSPSPASLLLLRGAS